MVTELSTTPLCGESFRSPLSAQPSTPVSGNEPSTLLGNTEPSNPYLSSEAALTEMEEIVASDSDSDESYSPDSEVNADAQMQGFCDEWVPTLDRDDLQALSILLRVTLVSKLGLTILKAASIISEMLGKSERTIREWWSIFTQNDFAFSGTLQGAYQRSGILWSNEELNEKVRAYVHENAAKKGVQNMTAMSFTVWVNNELLPSQALDPGFPRHIHIETARKWLHELGFFVMDRKKGIYYDGHERLDVVAYRERFFRKVTALGFLNRENAPTPAAAQSLPAATEIPSNNIIEKNVVIFHDESTFQANDDEPMQWGDAAMKKGLLRPKSKGAGIMVSDFIDEKNEYLKLTNEQYSDACKQGILVKKEARVLLEYGENCEGYWNSAKFLKQIADAVEIAEFKYPRTEGYRLYWIFDHSSCHAAYPQDALNASHMNAKPGGAQPVMHDTYYNGKLQRMVLPDGTPKGLRLVLEERGVNVKGMKLEDMQAKMAMYSDFQDEKSSIERYLHGRGHGCIMLPKYHCELNPIERCWAQAKRFSRSHCNYTLPSLRKVVPNALDSVSLENIQNHFRKVRHYMFSYLVGKTGGPELEEQVKTFKKEYKSHRRIPAIE